MSSTYPTSQRHLRLSHPRPSRPQHVQKKQPNPITIMFLVEDPTNPETDTETAPAAKGAKVTQRMLQLRELIAEGSYPDKDELAERIVDKL